VENLNEIVIPDNYRLTTNLSSNESAFGKFKSYPYSWPLYEKLSKYYNISEEKILLTFGSEQGIRFVFDTFVSINGNVLRPDPTFGMLEVFEYYRNANVFKIKYENLKIEINYFFDKLNNSNIQLFYIANPDNPTGSMIDLNVLTELIRVAKNRNTMVLLDEAYYHYNDISTTDLIDLFDNLIIVRSFSKAFGLAGERIGYILSDKKNIEKLSLQRPMNEVTQNAINLAIKALNEKTLKKNIIQVKKWKKIFLDNFPKNYVQSYCNFIILKLNNIETIKKIFDSNKIAVKCFEDKYLRIGIGKNKEMKKVIGILIKNQML